MKLPRACLLLILCLSPAIAAERSLPPLQTVESLDLDRFAGRWYEVARLPNKWQEDCAGNVRARYTLREDGRLDVFNQCSQADGDLRSVSGVARKVDEDGPASRLEVRFAPGWLSFLPVVWGEYSVIDIAPDYSWAAVGDSDRESFWILSRSPQLAEDTVRKIVERAEEQGFDLSGLLRTPHSEIPAATRELSQ